MDTNELAQKYEVITEDLEYGRAGDTPLLARLYRPRGITGFPAIVDVHGGAWVANDRLQNAAMDQVIAAAGTAVLALDFRLAPASPYPASVADINLGIRWLKANIAKLGGDASRIGGLGTSSGGHQLWLNVLRPRDPRYAATKLAGAVKAFSHRRTNGEYWNPGSPEDFFRNGTEQELHCASASMCTQNREVNLTPA